MKIKNIIAGIALSATLVGGVLTGVSLNQKANEAKAATATTVYYAVPSSVVGSYTVKLNINRKGDGDDWATYTMSRDGTKTQGGKLLYKATYTDLYNGVGAMQFQLYEGDTWKSQDQPISSWTGVSTYNGKVHVHGTSGSSAWVAYNPDTVTYTVTQYKVLDGGSPISIGSETVAQGATYPVPTNRYEAGYTFNGWYTTSACTTKYTAKAINANTSVYAKYTSGTWSGTINIDLRDSGWSEASANYAVLFMDKTTYPEEVDAWSTYKTGTTTGQKLVQVPYNIPFEPKQMLIARYNSSYSQSSWNTQKWPTDGNLWGQTNDIDGVSSVVRIGNNEGNKNAYLGYPKVIGGTGGAWADILYLEDIKMNGSNNVEYYSTTVTLAANTSFKIQVAPYADGDYYGTYSTHDSLKNNFSGGGSSNILAKVAGTYAFYFDSFAGSLYITKVEIAEADEWAQYFLANVGCDSTGRNLPSGWSTCATEYAKLSGPAKDIVYGATASEGGTYVEQAVARYDVAVRNHPSLTKFIVNSGDTPRSAAIANVPSIFRSSETSNTILIVVIFSAIAVTAIGGYFFLRHRKEK